MMNIKKLICNLLIISITARCLTACDNNVGGINSRIANRTNLNLTQTVGESQKTTQKLATVIFNDVIESGDTLYVADTLRIPQLIYLSPNDYQLYGITVDEAQLVHLIQDKAELMTFIKNNLTTATQIKLTNGSIAQANNPAAVYFNAQAAEVYFLKFNDSKTWQEYRIDLTKLPLTGELKQQRQLKFGNSLADGASLIFYDNVIYDFKKEESTNLGLSSLKLIKNIYTTKDGPVNDDGEKFNDAVTEINYSKMNHIFDSLDDDTTLGITLDRPTSYVMTGENSQAIADFILRFSPDATNIGKLPEEKVSQDWSILAPILAAVVFSLIGYGSGYSTKNSKYQKYIKDINEFKRFIKLNNDDILLNALLPDLHPLMNDYRQIFGSGQYKVVENNVNGIKIQTTYSNTIKSLSKEGSGFLEEYDVKVETKNNALEFTFKPGLSLDEVAVQLAKINSVLNDASFSQPIIKWLGAKSEIIEENRLNELANKTNLQLTAAGETDFTKLKDLDAKMRSSEENLRKYYLQKYEIIKIIDNFNTVRHPYRKEISGGITGGLTGGAAAAITYSIFEDKICGDEYCETLNVAAGNSSQTRLFSSFRIFEVNYVVNDTRYKLPIAQNYSLSCKQIAAELNSQGFFAINDQKSASIIVDVNRQVCSIPNSMTLSSFAKIVK